MEMNKDIDDDDDDVNNGDGDDDDGGGGSFWRRNEWNSQEEERKLVVRSLPGLREIYGGGTYPRQRMDRRRRRHQHSFSADTAARSLHTVPSLPRHSPTPCLPHREGQKHTHTHARTHAHTHTHTHTHTLTHTKESWHYANLKPICYS